MTAPHTPPRRIARAALLLAGWLAVPSRVAAGPPATFVIGVSDPRPLAAAADEVQKRYGLAVCYEDPAYEHKDDLADLSRWIDTRGIPRLVPGGTGLKLDPGPSDTGGGLIEPEALLDALIQKHAELEQPGRFRVQREGSLLQIVPTHVRDQEGSLSPVTPLLDTTIAIGLSTRPLGEALALIRDRLAASAGVPVMLGWAPRGALGQHAVQVGGPEQSARALLTQLLSQLPRPASWRLLYDPEPRHYVLNLLAVPRREASVGLAVPPPKVVRGVAAAPGEDAAATKKR